MLPHVSRIRRWPAQRDRARQFVTEMLERRTLLSVEMATLATIAGQLSAPLVSDAAGNLYFAEASSGAGNGGSIVRVAAGTNDVTTLLTFSSSPSSYGSNPVGLAVDPATGNIYGVTSSHGPYGNGNVFELTAGAYSALYDPTNDIGGSSGPPVVAGSDLYFVDTLGAPSMYGLAGVPLTGFTSSSLQGQGNISAGAPSTAGGPFGLVAGSKGNVFDLFPASESSTDGSIDAFSNLITNFDGTDGADPFSSLTVDDAGDVYGTTSSGGAYGDGTLFEVPAGTTALDTILSFQNKNQVWVTSDAVGDLFCTSLDVSSSGGATSSIFEVPAGTDAIQTLLQFDAGVNVGPVGSMVADSAGNLYGESEGIDGSAVTIFKVTGAGFHTSGAAQSHTQLAVTQAPQNTVAGRPLTEVSVTLEDLNGNALPNLDGNLLGSGTGNVTLTINSGTSGATLGGTVTELMSDGVASFYNLTIDTPGTYTLIASDGIDQPGVSAPFTVAAAPTYKLVVTQSPTDADAGQVLGPLVVSAENPDGQLVTDTSGSVTLAINAGPSGATLSGETTEPLLSGIATFGDLSIAQPGAYMLTATAAAASSAVSNWFDVTATLPAKLAVDQITSFPFPSSETGASQFMPYGNDLLFDVDNTTVWLSDGTAAGTTALTLNPPGIHLLVGVVGNEIFYTTGGYTVETYYSGSGYYTKIVPAASELYVTSDMGQTETDLGPVPAGTGFGASLAANGNLYFATSTAMWVSDGTKSGTAAIDSSLLGDGSTPVGVIGNTIFITNGSDLFASNGTAVGTLLLSNSSSGFTVFDGKGYFIGPSAAGATAGSPLWSTDGTTAGTVDVFANAPADEAPQLVGLGAAAGQLFLVAVPQPQNVSGPGSDLNLYTCDGTAGTVVRLSTLDSDYEDGNGAVSNIVSFDNQVALVVTTFNTPEELWMSDGTVAGTRGVEPVKYSYGPLVATADFLAEATPDQVPDPALFGAGGPFGPGQVFTYAQVTAAPTPKKTASLVGSLVQAHTGAIVSPGSQVTAVLTLANRGDAASTGAVTVQFYVSSDASMSDAIAATSRLAIDVNGIAPGKSRSYRLKFAFPADEPAGPQNLLAVFAPDGQNVTSVVDTTVASAPAVRALPATYPPGLGGHNGRSLSVLTSLGVSLTFSLKGKGLAAFAQTGADSYQLSFSGAAGSTLTIAPTVRGTSASISSLTIIGAVANVLAADVEFPNSTIAFNGNGGAISLGSVDGSTIALSGSNPVSLSALTMINSTITSSAPLEALSVRATQDNTTVTAGSIGQLSFGQPSNNCTVNAGDIGSIRVNGSANAINLTVMENIGPISGTGGLQSATLISNGSIGSIRLRDGIFNSNLYSVGDIGSITTRSMYADDILAGINVGADGVPGGYDDTFYPASIGAIDVSGAIQGALITAGLSLEVDLFPPTGGESLLPGSSLGAVTAGSIDSSSRLLAATVPVTAKIGRAVVPTTSDPTFQPDTTPLPMDQLTQLTNLPDTTGTAGPSDLIPFNNELFFLATNPATGKMAVWVSNGTVSGTAPLSLPASAANITGMAADQSLLFTAGQTLWTTNGTAAGTTTITLGSPLTSAQSLRVLGGNDFVQVTTTANGKSTYELWSTEGSTGPTDWGALAGPVSAAAGNLVGVGDQIFVATPINVPTDVSMQENAITLRGTISGATSVQELFISGQTELAIVNTPTTGGSSGQQLWSVSSEPNMLLDARITNLAYNGETVNFDAQPAGAVAPTLWTFSAPSTYPVQYFEGSPTAVSSSIFVYYPEVFGYTIVGFDSTDFSELKLFTISGDAFSLTFDAGAAGTFRPDDNIGYLGVPLFIAPSSNGLSLWAQESTGVRVVVNSVPDGQLYIIYNSLYEVSPSSSGSPGKLYVITQPSG